MGQPTLLYGTKGVSLTHAIFKSVLMLSVVWVSAKASHHTVLSRAAGIQSIHEYISTRILSLYKRVLNVESPTKRLNIYFLAEIYGR